MSDRGPRAPLALPPRSNPRPSDGNTLPAPLTPLIGREREVDQVGALLRSSDVHLLTLTGPGGAGKTRLSVAAAAAVAGEFGDGVAFVPLASITDHDLVLPTIAQAVGLREAGGPSLRDRLAASLHGRDLLLVIDNFEQVVAAAPVLTDLLASCPSLTMLVTSRAVLHVYGETDFPVPPLGLSPTVSSPSFAEVAASAASRLFVERAQAVEPRFVLTPENAGAVDEICRRLDGLPLAIELAAARVALFTPAGLAARLDRRLPLLTKGARDMPARLRTMRGAIAWSHDLLDADEQAFFQELSVFNGGCTLEAVEIVTSLGSGPAAPTRTVFDLVGSLIDKSLLLPARGDRPDAGGDRFRMLETIREFGGERLEASGAGETTRHRHATWCLALAEEAEQGLRGREQLAWLGRLEDEHDNLRAAVGWTLAALDGGEAAQRLTGALHWFWYLHGHWTEGRRVLEEALARPGPGGRSTARAKALAGAGILAFAQGDYGAASVRLEEAIATSRELEDRAGVAYGLHFLGWAALLHGDYAAGQARLGESVALFREVEESWGLATALCSFGIAAIQTGDEAAPSLVEESLARAQALGDAWGLARALHYAGEVARGEGDDARARALYQESLARYRELGDRNAVAILLHNLGYVAQHEGNASEAGTYFAEGLSLHLEHGDKRGLAHYVAGLAGTATLLGEPERAARLSGAAQALFAATGASTWPVDQREHTRNLAAARRGLSGPAFDAAWDAGQSLSWEQAIAEAAAVAAAAATLPGRPAAEPTEATGLSPRERDVLRLLVEGRSDKEIATALFISRRTASKHVAAILQKLDAPSRMAAATVAVRDGLV